MKRPHPTRGKKLRRDLLTDEEVEALLEACGDGDAGTRNRAFIALLAGTGVRISEALGLRMDDLDLRNQRAYVERGKTGERRVWVDKSVRAKVREWKNVRKRLGGCDLFFCNLHGEPLSPSYFRGFFPQLARAARIKKRVHAHGFRHFFACRAHRAGVPLRALSRQLGHARVSTTSTYLESLGIYDAMEEFDAVFS